MDFKKFFVWFIGVLAGLAALYAANEQVFLGVVSMLLVSGLSLYAQTTGKKIGKFWAQVILTVLALIFGTMKVLMTGDLNLPPFDGSSIFAFLTWLGATVTYLGPFYNGILASAVAIYNLLWAKVQDYISEGVRARLAAG